MINFGWNVLAPFPPPPTAFAHGDVIVPVTAATGHWAPVVGESLVPTNQVHGRFLVPTNHVR